MRVHNLIHFDDKLEAHDKTSRREKEWVGIIIHHTTIGGRKDPDPSMWKKLYKNLSDYLARKDKAYVSAHYSIGREGEVAQIVDPDKYESWHAGKSSYWHPIKRRVTSNWNRHSIGIELIGNGNTIEYSGEQYKALIKLCKELKDRFPSIHPLAIIGHENIAPKRKDDPGRLFDWERFFKGFYR